MDKSQLRGLKFPSNSCNPVALSDLKFLLAPMTSSFYCYRGYEWVLLVLYNLLFRPSSTDRVWRGSRPSSLPFVVHFFRVASVQLFLVPYVFISVFVLFLMLFLVIISFLSANG